MAGQSLNLKYLKKNNKFFSSIKQMNTTIENYKKTEPSVATAALSQKDSTEIGRGKSYAMFNELRTGVDDAHRVTIASLKEALVRRGVTDSNFQNKILCMLLQHRMGIHFPLVMLMNQLLADCHQLTLVMNPQYSLTFEVNSSRAVTLVFKSRWEDYSSEPRKPELSLCIKVNITPDMVAVNDFNVTRMSDSLMAKEVFQFFQENQQNIFEKLITFIKLLFGFNAELRLEEENNKNFVWPSVG